MSLTTQITAAIQAIAADTKTIGAVSSLTTTAKSTLVAALNELKSAIDSIVTNGAGIDDSGTGDDVTWSANKIQTAINNATDALVNGAPGTLDTLKELADYLDDNETLGTSLVAAIANRVSYADEQTLDSTQKAQAISNIGAISASDVGDVATDFVAIYSAAKA